MESTTDIDEALKALLQELLENFESRVPERGRFPDLRASRSVYFGDPDTTRPGHLELSVMHMDSEIDRLYDQMRFVAVRVWKSRDGGTASTTCFHGTRDEVRGRLNDELLAPEFLVERVYELAHGLPEESNPDLWR